MIHSKEESSDEDKFEGLIEDMMGRIVMDNKEVENIFYGSEFYRLSIENVSAVHRENREDVYHG